VNAANGHDQQHQNFPVANTHFPTGLCDHLLLS